MSDAEAAVRAHLAAERFPASDEEVRALTELYPGLLAMRDGMDEVKGVQEAPPDLVFDPTVVIRSGEDEAG